MTAPPTRVVDTLQCAIARESRESRHSRIEALLRLALVVPGPGAARTRAALSLPRRRYGPFWALLCPPTILLGNFAAHGAKASEFVAVALRASQRHFFRRIAAQHERVPGSHTAAKHEQDSNSPRARGAVLARRRRRGHAPRHRALARAAPRRSRARLRRAERKVHVDQGRRHAPGTGFEADALLEGEARDAGGPLSGGRRAG